MKWLPRPLAGFLVLATLIPAAQAQTIERYAGGGRLVDSPGHLTPIFPSEIAVAPDGRLFFIHAAEGNIYRYDPTTQTATIMPEEEPGSPHWPPVYSYFRDLTVDAAGTVYAVQGGSTIRRLLANGHDEHFAGGGSSSGGSQCSGTQWYPATFGSIDDIAALPSGRILLANASENMICLIDQGGSSQRLAGQWGSGGFDGDGGNAHEARFNAPRSIATDGAGHIYVADSGNHRIRKFSFDDYNWTLGDIHTIAGTGVPGYNGDDIPAETAQITEPQFLTVDGAGNVYFYDRFNNRVRRVDGSTGLISTVAGNGNWGYTGDGGPATSASLSEVSGLVIHPDGSLYISDAFNYRVRRVDPVTGVIDAVLGNGTTNFCGDGPRLQTCIDMPEALAVDAQGNVYFADLGNKRVRRIDAATGMTSTVAGNYSGVEFDENGNPVVSEHGGDGGPAVDASFGSGPWGVAVDAAGNLYIATGYDHRIRRVDAASGIITTIAGNGVGSSSGDGGPAADATVNMPNKIVVAPNGDLYFSEANGNRVRKIEAITGTLTTVAGTGLASGPLGDGGPGSLASLSSPSGLAFDGNGDLLIVDQGHSRLRKLSLDTGIITTVAGTGVSGWEGDGGPATSAQLGYPITVAVDAADNIFVTTGFRLRRIDANTGIINRANASWGFYTPDGLGIQQPTQMSFGPDGSLFISDASEHVIFRVPDMPLTPVDSTPPVITPVITGTVGTDGWYRSNVTLRWNVTDPESAFEYPGPTCGLRAITTDTAGVTYTCTTTSAGGVASASVTIKRDTVAPTLSFGTATPAADANGWHQSDVSVPFTASDALSGVFSTSTPNPVVITGSGTGLTRQVTVTDLAGNSATFTTPAVNIDRTPPGVQPVVTGTLGQNGWYTSDVQVAWAIDEAPGSIIATTGCESSVVSEDTAGVTFSCSVTSAGGSASSSVTIKRDATPPVLTFGTPSPAPNANGWNKTNVSIPFTRSDAMSGLASTSTASPLVLRTEGANVTGQVVVTDNAGNSATFTSVPRSIDKTAPEAEMNTPEDGRTYGFYQDVVADFWCNDISLVSCTAPTPNGELINTRSAGARTFRVTAKDAAGFTTYHTHSFTVESTFNFSGFLGAVSSPPTLNLVPRGALVPIRWQLPDGRGGYVTNPASFASATVGSLSCGSAAAVPLNDTAAGPAGISFDPATHSFVYNWQTNASWTGCRKLTIKLRDGSTHELRFRFQ